MSGATMDAAGWDARYAGADLVWSAGPNVWVRELCTPLTPGRALDVAAGEGRNALWLVEQGWTVVAADFSPVGVARMDEIADRRLAQRRSAFTAVVADATQPAPNPPYDLVLISYLHLPRTQWGEALAAAVRATVVGGVVLVVVHAVRNLTAGVGGPQDPTILLDPEDVIASGAELPVDVELAQLRARDVPGAARPALDTVVLFRKRADA
ncbi:MAG TPA: class I SAM-dependent methyltransferase [Ornithinibacter sp.]|nr:class I SAM-dependent methyltransferase [Ornithinibacter sp.]